jgi:transthyretin-like family protein
MQFVARFRRFALVPLVLSIVAMAGQALADETIRGQVQGGGAPIANSTVTLWQARGDAPKQLAQAKTNGDGRFEVRGKDAANDTIVYLTASGGTAKAKQGSGDTSVIVLLSVLGNKPPDKVVINELTTVASANTGARFINGTSISGNPFGLRIAAGMRRISSTRFGCSSRRQDPVTPKLQAARSFAFTKRDRKVTRCCDCSSIQQRCLEEE